MRQSCTYWQQDSVRNNDGERTYLPPVQIKCRWSDKSELIQKSNEEKVLTRSKVMVPVDMKEGDYLMFGELDSSTPSDPIEGNPTAFPIILFKKIPNLKAREFLRVAYLSNRG